jgi:hypothetical protein
VRLGYDIGNIDGRIGLRTNAAVAKAGAVGSSVDATLAALEDLAQKKFPLEYAVGQPASDGTVVPEHVIG